MYEFLLGHCVPINIEFKWKMGGVGGEKGSLRHVTQCLVVQSKISEEWQILNSVYFKCLVHSIT